MNQALPMGGGGCAPGAVPWFSARTLAFVSGFGAALVELLVMRVNPLVPEGRAWPLAGTNAVLVGLLLGSGLYLLVFRPLEHSARHVREIEALLLSRGAAPHFAMTQRHREARFWSWPTLLLGLGIFASELVAIRLFPFLTHAHPFSGALVDAFFLTLLLTPALHYFLLRPLRVALDQCRKAEDALRRAATESAREAQACGTELSRANERLREEVLERTRAEQELRTSETRYRLLVESMNEGLCVVDADGVLTYANQKLAEMMGYPTGELAGRRPEEFFSEESLPLLEEQQKRRRRAERGVYQVNLRSKEGEEVPVLISSTPLLGEDGSVQGSFAVVTDIGEIKRAEEDLRHWRTYLQLLSAELLTAQERERERVARELHDGIGQTLSAVKFQIETACAGDSEKRELMESVVARLKGAVDEVRRIGMALRPSILDDLGLLATVGWFCREFRQTYPGFALEPQLSLKEEDVPEPLKIVIFRVLQEALNNVAKHSHAARVRVCLAREADALVLEVADDGVGFDVEAALALRSTRRSLGLDSMRERTQLSGGSFWIDSEAGLGTTVKASWPVPAAGAEDLSSILPASA
ncbi:MAG: PAS domain S-box protein [Thermodesulfobacteriota bacterium]